jgi:hypothetical protein
MKSLAVTQFTVLRGARLSVPPGEVVVEPFHMREDGFYILEAISGVAYNIPPYTLLFRVSIPNGNEQVFQELALGGVSADADGFYPFELLSPGVVLALEQPRLEELIELDYLIPPRGMAQVQILNNGPATVEAKLALRFRKVKGVMWDEMLAKPRIENIFQDPRSVEHDNLEDSDDVGFCEVAKC